MRYLCCRHSLKVDDCLVPEARYQSTRVALTGDLSLFSVSMHSLNHPKHSIQPSQFSAVAATSCRSQEQRQSRKSRPGNPRVSLANACHLQVDLPNQITLHMSPMLITYAALSVRLLKCPGILLKCLSLLSLTSFCAEVHSSGCSCCQTSSRVVCESRLSIASASPQINTQQCDA